MSNTLKIDTFKSKLSGGGARPSLFEVFLGTQINLPDPEMSIMVKAAQLPASIISPIPVPFRGRQLPVAGDRTFEPWTITVINDNNFMLRNAFEEWSNKVQEHVSGQGTLTPADYMTDMWVKQLDRREESVKTYHFTGVWCSNISAIDLSYDAENTIEEFTVELQVTYWYAADSTDIPG